MGPAGDAETTPVRPLPEPRRTYALAHRRAILGFEGHPFAYERVIRWVRNESGRRRRVMTYRQPEDGFEAWTPPLGYFTVLWHAYSRLGFDVEPLARAAGVSP